MIKSEEKEIDMVGLSYLYAKYLEKGIIFNYYLLPIMTYTIIKLIKKGVRRI